jgi:Family of unknown function (DUF6011)
MTHALKSAPEILNFITAGKAFFTIKNSRTQNRFTYNVEAPDGNPLYNKENTGLLFVSLLVGSDNYTNYKYIGLLRLNRNTKRWSFEYGRKSKIGENVPSVQGFAMLFNNVISALRPLEMIYPDVEFWHEGKCCRCGRKLTVPESIASGIGPECRQIKTNYHTHIIG